MLRSFLRFIGFWVLAGALVAAVLDGVRSIAASEMTVTPISETWAALGPESLARLEASLTEGLGQPWLWDLVSAWILGAPTALALAVLGFLFIAAGRKGRRDRYAAEFVT